MEELTCANCCWYADVKAPAGTKRSKRGYCLFEPPRVFPMPKQKQSKIAALGQPKQDDFDIIPLMLRPVVEAHEPMCGRFSPNAETAEELGLIGGCGGCEDDDAKCKCKEEEE